VPRIGASSRLVAREGLLGLVFLVLGLAAVALISAPRTARSQESPAAGAPATIDSTAEAGEPSPDEPKRRMVKWNEYEGPVSTFRFGYGFLVDMATFSQDADAKQQAEAKADAGLRDFRLLFKGRFKTERPFSWTIGYMYDGTDKSWHFRKTGIQVGLPELSGNIFIGRDKEGYSLIKIMVGYDGWTIERSTALDAFVPILADGIKYNGYSPAKHMIWNVGLFNDALSNRESFSAFHNLAVARVGWLPILSEEEGKLLHIAVMLREGQPEDDLIKQRSRPEMYLTPYFVDTGQFPATRASTRGFEIYYRAKNLLIGTEQNFQHVTSSSAGNPDFYGGEAVVSYVLTGETRPYNTASGSFRSLSPARTVFEGGRGAWDVGLRYSYIDLNGGTLRGGTFWRLTPTVNWYLSDNFRVDMAYGYGVLDRFDLKGATQFFQARLQTTL
jgi:phosphate-selective porin OprO and OprP